MNIDKDFFRLLRELGLSENETMTYIALLQMEHASIRKLAAATGINRGTTYEVLKQLVGQGLISVKSTGKREAYTAESPDKVFELIRDRRRDLLDISASAKTIIPRVIAQQPRPDGRPIVRYFEGDDGIVTILKDVLQTCSLQDNPNYCAYSSSHIRQYLYRKFPQFTDRRIAAGIMVRVIAAETGHDIAPVSERKVLPTSGNDIASYSLIYGNKVATVSISSNLTPYGVVIEDQSAASMQRLLFDQLWNYLPSATS